MAESVFFKGEKYELQQLIRPCLQPKQPLCTCFVFVLSLLGHRSTKPHKTWHDRESFHFTVFNTVKFNTFITVFICTFHQYLLEFAAFLPDICILEPKEQIYCQRNRKSWICSSSPALPQPPLPWLCNKHSSFAHISRSNDVDSRITLMRFGL